MWHPHFFAKNIFYYFAIHVSTELTTEIRILKSNAGKSEATSNPSTIYAVSNTINAFTRKVNNPKVRKLIGSVRRSRTGLTTALMTPKTIATTTADFNPPSCTPGITKDAI